MRKEACILAQLQHPNIVELKGLGFLGNSCKLGMMLAYYPESLQEIIDDGDGHIVDLLSFAQQTISWYALICIPIYYCFIVYCD